MTRPAKMPRKSDLSAPESNEEQAPEEEVVTTEADAEESSTETDVANDGGDEDDLDLQDGFGDAEADPDPKEGTGKRPKTATRKQRQGKQQGKKPAQQPKLKKRMKPATMAGRSQELPRKLGAAILRYWFAKIEGEASGAEEDSRPVSFKFTAEEIAELLRVPEDDTLEKEKNRHPLAADLQSHFGSIEGKAKWKVNSPTKKVARTQAELVICMREKIANLLGFDSVEKVTTEKINQALAKSEKDANEKKINSALQAKGLPPMHGASTTAAAVAAPTAQQRTQLSVGEGIAIGCAILSVTLLIWVFFG